MGSTPKGKQHNRRPDTQDDEVAQSRFLHQRCFVYDSESGKNSIRLAHTFTEGNKYQKIPLRPRQKHIKLFRNEDDQASEKWFKTEEEAKEDQYPVLFSKLDLGGPGIWNKFLLMSGSLSTLYVSKGDAHKGSASDTSPLVSSARK
ncbi:MAG: hypothetical protein M1820_001592 [Bogoriella megaspora]|nr:MAG: hypothetical protein M1820_001592 [Bogoriella megaspora]